MSSNITISSPPPTLWAKIVSTTLDTLTQSLGPLTCLLIIITIRRNRKLWTLVNCVVVAETIFSLALNIIWPIWHIVGNWTKVSLTLQRIISNAAQILLCCKLGFYFSIAAARYSIICRELSIEMDVRNATIFIVLAIVYAGLNLILPIYFNSYICKLVKHDRICRNLLRTWIIIVIIGSIFAVAIFYIQITRKIKASVKAQERYGAKPKKNARKDIVTTISSILQLTLTFITFIPYPVYFISGYKSINTTPGTLMLSITIFIAATLDPVLYLVFSSDFRKAFRQLVGLRTITEPPTANNSESTIGSTLHI